MLSALNFVTMGNVITLWFLKKEEEEEIFGIVPAVNNEEQVLQTQISR